MSIKQVSSVFIYLEGDGSSTTFTLSLQNLYRLADSGYGAPPFLSYVPSSISVNKPPIPVTSVDIDDTGNISMVLASPISSGEVLTFQLVFAYDGGGALVSTVLPQNATPTRRASVDISSSGDHVIVSGIAGQTIRVWKIFLECATFGQNTSFLLKDGAVGMHGPLLLGDFVLDTDAEPWFVTSIGNSLVANVGSSVQVSGVVYYTQS